jgi:hypothetical protein
MVRRIGQTKSDRITEGSGIHVKPFMQTRSLQMWIEQNWGTAIEFASITHGDD